MDSRFANAVVEYLRRYSEGVGDRSAELRKLYAGIPRGKYGREEDNNPAEGEVCQSLDS